MASELYVETLKGLTSGANANKVIIPSGQTLEVAGDWTPPAGTVLQVVQVDTTTQVTTTSNTFVTTGHSLTITPSSTNSKIYIVGTGPVYNTSSGAGGQTTIYRGSTNINAATHGMGYLYTAGGDEGCSAISCKLDSPNTTSAVTYTMYFRQVGGGTFYYSVNQGMSTLTAMEIAG